MYHNKLPSKWQRNSVTTIFPLSQHKGQNIDRCALSRQKIACYDCKWEEYNKSAETKKVYVATKFLVGSQHKEEIVATKKLLSLQMKQEEGKNSVATRYLLS